VPYPRDPQDSVLFEIEKEVTAQFRAMQAAG
jgi:hypothetical protein